MGEDVYVPSPIMRYFQFGHLLPELQQVSEPFFHLAEFIDETLPNGDEKTVALRRLLESKDAAVRTLV